MSIIASATLGAVVVLIFMVASHEDQIARMNQRIEELENRKS